MTVHCEGDCGVIEQLGEKQDFEAELSRRGFRHEHFVLHVVEPRRGKSGWGKQTYSVTVEHVVADRQRVYQGGPGNDWVRECARDLGNGVFGDPMRQER
jgi:hypothetical protein